MSRDATGAVEIQHVGFKSLPTARNKKEDHLACPTLDVSVKGLRKAHFIQLLAYIEDRERDMWHYGRKNHFETRHKDLKEWCEEMIDMFK